MRSGLHNVGLGFINGLAETLHHISCGFVRKAPTPAGGGDALLLESGDNLLLETGDNLLLE